MKHIILLLLMTGCSSYSEKVIQYADDVDSKPKWATTTKTMWHENGIVYAVGFNETGDNGRLSSIMRVADNNARFEISRKINNDMAFVFQNMEEGSDEASSLVRFYGAEVSKTLLYGLKQEERFWEKVLVTSKDDDEIKLRTYSLVSIPLSTLKKTIKEISNKSKNIDPKIREQMNDHLARELQKLGQD